MYLLVFYILNAMLPRQWHYLRYWSSEIIYLIHHDNIWQTLVIHCCGSSDQMNIIIVNHDETWTPIMAKICVVIHLTKHAQTRDCHDQPWYLMAFYNVLLNGTIFSDHDIFRILWCTWYFFTPCSWEVFMFHWWYTRFTAGSENFIIHALVHV